MLLVALDSHLDLYDSKATSYIVKIQLCFGFSILYHMLQKYRNNFYFILFTEKKRHACLKKFKQYIFLNVKLKDPYPTLTPTRVISVNSALCLSQELHFSSGFSVLTEWITPSSELLFWTFPLLFLTYWSTDYDGRNRQNAFELVPLICYSYLFLQLQTKQHFFWQKNFYWLLFCVAFFILKKDRCSNQLKLGRSSFQNTSGYLKIRTSTMIDFTETGIRMKTSSSSPYRCFHFCLTSFLMLSETGTFSILEHFWFTVSSWF